MALRAAVNKMLASTQVELKKASLVVPNVLKHVGTCDVEEGCDKNSIMNHDGILPGALLWCTPCCQPLLTPWLTRMYVCVHRLCTLFARCARVRTCCGETVVLPCVDPNITDVTQKRLCHNVFGEDVCRIVGGVDPGYPHNIVCDQLLYEQVFEFNVFRFL